MNPSVQKPLVSVVIPVYNRAHILGGALDSLSRQSYQKFEVIIVDDCSEDGEELAALLSQYPTLTIRYTRHSTNRHGAAARNTGVQQSSGDFIAFLDSDDTWREDKLFRCLTTFQDDPEIDVVYSKFLARYNNKKSVTPNRGHYPSERFSDYLLYSGGSMQTSTLVVRATCARNLCFDEDLKRYQDFDYCLRLERAGVKAKFIDEVLVFMSTYDVDNRISSAIDPEPAIFWLKKIQPYISKKARSNFQINRIAPLEAASGNLGKALLLASRPQHLRDVGLMRWAKGFAKTAYYLAKYRTGTWRKSASVDR